MSELITSKNESKAAAAFSKQAPGFDQLYEANSLIRYKRDRVRTHIERFLPAQAHILELNCGTGNDALYFAQKGYAVHATDIATRMLAEARKKAEASKAGPISFEQCSFTNLDELQHKGPYDAILSNFGGLNCTDQLEKVIQSFDPLLKENGTVTLVIISKFCLWELLLLFRGKFKTAARRLFGNSSKAKVEGEHFRCWYYKPLQVRRFAGNNYELLSVEGLCTIVPPSYIEQFPERYPRLFSLLERLEHKWKAAWPFKNIGDYFIITLRKKSG